MKITQLQRGKKSKRINVYVDEEYSFSVEETTLVKENLFQGKEITEIEIENIVNRDLVEKFSSKSVELIGRRPRSAREVRDYIYKKLNNKEFYQFEKEEINDISAKVVKKLTEKEYLNDEEFAKWWIENRMINKPRGKYMLKSELFKKGISSQIIEKQLKTISKHTEIIRAQELAEKKYRIIRLREKDKRKISDKMYRYLASKGYSYGIARKVLEQLYNGTMEK